MVCRALRPRKHSCERRTPCARRFQATVGDEVLHTLGALPHDTIDRKSTCLVRRSLLRDEEVSDVAPGAQSTGAAGAYVYPVHEYDAAMVKLAEGAHEQAHWELGRHGALFEQTRLLEYEGPGAWRVTSVSGYKPTKLVQGGDALYSMVALCRPVPSRGRAAVRSPEVSDEEARGAVLRREVYPSLPALACPSCLNSDPAQVTRAGSRRRLGEATRVVRQLGHGFVLGRHRRGRPPTGSIDPHLDRVVAVQRESTGSTRQHDGRVGPVRSPRASTTRGTPPMALLRS